MQVLYKTSYIERNLYVVEHEGKYLMVYASSGMNPGRKGRILPFNMLKDSASQGFSDDTPGYIFKEFFFEGMWTNHQKRPGHFKPGIAEFLVQLEEFLADHIPEHKPYDHIVTYGDIIPVAADINKELETAIGDLKPYDWNDIKD